MADAIASQEPQGGYPLGMNPTPAPPPAWTIDEENGKKAITEMQAAGLSRRETAHLLELLTNLSRNEAYQLVHQIHRQ